MLDKLLPARADNTYHGYMAALYLLALGVIVLARYRSLVPLMFVVLLAEHLLRRLILLVMPIPREGAPPGLYINLVISTVMLVGLVLSLRQRA